MVVNDGNKDIPITPQDNRQVDGFDRAVCINAVDLARDFIHVSDLIYTREWGMLSLFHLMSGKNSIGHWSKPVPKTEVEKYEKHHRELSVKYSKYAITKRISKIMNDLEKLENPITDELEKFVRVIQLPGYCVSCKNPQRKG